MRSATSMAESLRSRESVPIEVRRLAHGALHQHTIVCPWHAWEFDCRTGVGDCADIATIPVTIIGDQIYLNAGTARS